MDLTVAICTRNRRSSLLETLDSLEGQQWTGRWGVLVVDNGSSDGSAQAILERARKFPVPLSVAAEQEPGLSFARNRALRAAQGRVIVFIDDDVTCPTGWLEAHARAFAEPRVLATGGPIKPSMPPDTPTWFSDILSQEVGGPTARYEFGDELAEILPNGPIPLPFGANMGVVRELALELGGFRTDLGWGKRMLPCEELEFLLRVQERPGAILYVPDAALLHRIESRRTTRAYWSGWQRSYGRSAVLMNPPQGMAAWAMELARGMVDVVRLGRCARSERKRGELMREMDARREQERGKGRVLELLRL